MRENNRGNSTVAAHQTDPSTELFGRYAKHYARAGADRWHKPLNEIRAFHLERLPRWIKKIPSNARILDAGCATGYLLALLYAEGYENLTGVEISPEMAALARENLPQSVEIKEKDLRDFLFECSDGSFDLILLHHVLEHIPRQYTIPLLYELRRCLSPEGYLNIKVPNASYILGGIHCYGDFTHVVHFNERSLLQVLEAAGFESEKVEFILHPPKLFWSWRHPGRAFLRLLNRGRWHIHRLLHLLLCGLADQHPAPYVFEVEIEALAKR